MLDPQLPAWPRPYFKAGDLATKIFFVCFGRAPFAEIEISRSRFGLPAPELLGQVDVREHRREASRSWFEAWWGGPFGVIAERDLAEDLALLTTSNTCFTVQLELPDQADLSPLQTAWGL